MNEADRSKDVAPLAEPRERREVAPLSAGGVLACVDASDYAPAVCDYAAWFAGRTSQPVTLLHAESPTERFGRSRWVGRSPRPIRDGMRRLQNDGVEGVLPLIRRGDFPATAIQAARHADVVVMGKRGAQSERERLALGSCVDAVLRGAERPVCLVAKTFLPVHRALVLLDADPEHRRTVEFVASSALFAGLELDLVLIDDGLADPAPKLDWARDKLAPHKADIFPMMADGPHTAVATYLNGRGADMLILSRELALPDVARRLRRIDDQSFWSWRMPVLVC